MKPDALGRLIEGYRDFHARYISEQYADYRKWARNEQQPQVMIIACSDSRINPAILTHAGLGDIFMVNNVANLVPPYKEGWDTHHSTSAAVEFAVKHLKISHIIVLGHTNCGGIRALIEGETSGGEKGEYSFIGPWMNIASPAKEQVKRNHPDTTKEVQAFHCERASLLLSLGNLHSFPWVLEAVGNGKLRLHAWHFDVGTGNIEQYDAKRGIFTSLLDEEVT